MYQTKVELSTCADAIVRGRYCWIRGQDWGRPGSADLGRIGLNLRDMPHFPAWPRRTLAVEVYCGAGNGQPLLVIVDLVADQVGHGDRAVPDRLAERPAG